VQPRGVRAHTMGSMRRLLLIAGAGASILAGCGSATKTVTVSSVPGAATAPGRTSTQTTSTQAPTETTTTTGTGTGSTSPTRTAPEPSFTEGESTAKAGSLAAAVALVKAHGYTPVDSSEYHPGQTLRVLVGTRTGSGDGYGQQAFFFVDGHYIGTDAKEPSAKLAVVSQNDTEVAIAYPLYRRNDPLCCPSGGRRVVHFALNNGKLQPLEEIPPANGYANLSRY
jgi:LppP/LprE lipoprotein